VNSNQENFNPANNDNSQNQDQDYDFDFNGAPLFTNNNIGVAVYPQKDKNGNWYLKINLPLVDDVRVFVNNNSHEGLEESFNKLVDHFNE